MDPISPVTHKMFGFGLSVDNVNEALPLALALLDGHGVPTESRGGDVLRIPGPVSTIYRTPQRRVLFDVYRDANPFFHLIEAMWILSGSNRVALPAMFLEGIRRFSDDGVTFHGAYGHRLRHWVGNVKSEKYGPVTDQINSAVQLLVDDPSTRQCVLSIWNPALDFAAKTKDVPCNDMIMLDIVDNRLNMTVCNRSNDVIWGAYGANVVQFSVLQEWMAAAIGVDVGYYVQQSNNFHVYTDNPTWKKFLELGGHLEDGHVFNPYMQAGISFEPMATGPAEARAVMRDCEKMEARVAGGLSLLGGDYESHWFQNIIWPMVDGYLLWKDKRPEEAIAALDRVKALDWRMACQAWVMRRLQARSQA